MLGRSHGHGWSSPSSDLPVVAELVIADMCTRLSDRLCEAFACFGQYRSRTERNIPDRSTRGRDGMTGSATSKRPGDVDLVAEESPSTVFSAGNPSNPAVSAEPDTVLQPDCRLEVRVAGSPATHSVRPGRPRVTRPSIRVSRPSTCSDSVPSVTA